MILRDRLLDLLKRHNRFDLMLRELRVIEDLDSPVSDFDDPHQDELFQHRMDLRSHCESRLATIQEQIGTKLDNGVSGELAPHVYSSGFVLEALRLLNLDQKTVAESSELVVLQNLLRLEAGRSKRFMVCSNTNQNRTGRLGAFRRHGLDSRMENMTRRLSCGRLTWTSHASRPCPPS